MEAEFRDNPLKEERDSLSARGGVPKPEAGESPPDQPHPQTKNRTGLSEEPFRLLVESVKDYAIFLLDSQGRVVSWNKGAERIKGYKKSEIVGHHFSIFYPQEDIDKGNPERELVQAREQGQFEEEGWRLRQDGSRFWASVVITALFDEQGQLVGFVKVTRDMSERKETQDLLHRLNLELEKRVKDRTDELEAANKLKDQLLLAEREARQVAQAAQRQSQQALKARELFLSVAAHELKTPITSLSGYVQLLLRHQEREGRFEPQRVERALVVIGQQAHKLTRLVDRLLNFSRLEAGKLKLEQEHLDLRPLVEGIIELEKLKSAKHSIEFKAPALPVIALVDPLRFEQVLTNLLDNAIKYSPKGGVIEISLLPPTPPQNEVRLRVKDQGIGIEPAKRKGLFEPFYQGHDHSYSGMGLGLYISREIIELHGGKIEVTFPEEEGTSFEVVLPILGAKQEEVNRL